MGKGAYNAREAYESLSRHERVMHGQLIAGYRNLGEGNLPPVW